MEHDYQWNSDRSGGIYDVDLVAENVDGWCDVEHIHAASRWAFFVKWCLFDACMTWSAKLKPRIDLNLLLHQLTLKNNIRGCKSVELDREWKFENMWHEHQRELLLAGRWQNLCWKDHSILESKLITNHIPGHPFIIHLHEDPNRNRTSDTSYSNLLHASVSFHPRTPQDFVYTKFANFTAVRASHIATFNLTITNASPCIFTTTTICITSCARFI